MLSKHVPLLVVSGFILVGVPLLVSTAFAQDTDILTAEASAEYRVRSVAIDPIDLSGTEFRRIQWTEQRLRVEGTARHEGLVALHLQLDALDGVLFGDNGSFGGSPSSNSGVSLAAKRPNLTRWATGLTDPSDPLNPDKYGPVLVDAPLLELNYAYADVSLPIGLLRVGRQPLNYGASITAHDGGRHNRWGASEYSDGVDRILFGTKIDEIVRTIAKGGHHRANTSQEQGVLLGVFYDFMKQDEITTHDDDLRQIGASLQWREKRARWLGLEWRNFLLGQSLVRQQNSRFETAVYGMPFVFRTKVDRLGVDLQAVAIYGETLEVAEGFAALTSKRAEVQKLEAYGARAVFDVDLDRVVLTLEGDYASGDADPRTRTPITSFSFARDLNVGLLLFERVLAFESARSVAVGIENLAGSDLESFPLTEVQTDGRFTAAAALFPQVRVDLLRHRRHRVHARLGVLMAWPSDRDGAVDAIMTALAEDGHEIKDDAVNFYGGAPGSYYGTEFDGQLGYTLGDHFAWTVEGAYLVPGSSLKDEHGDAVPAFLLENRLEFMF